MARTCFHLVLKNLERLLWHSRIGSVSAVPGGKVQYLAQHSGLKDQALLQVWHRSQQQLGSSPWPRNSICHWAAKKGGEGEGDKLWLSGYKPNTREDVGSIPGLPQ